MVRENRIKEYIFPAQTFSATGNLAAVYSPSLNGEVLDIEWNFARAGSYWLAESGTGIEIWRRNLASGANWQKSSPRLFTESTTGSIANAEHVPFNTHGPLYIAGSGNVSGTATLQVTLRYR